MSSVVCRLSSNTPFTLLLPLPSLCLAPTSYCFHSPVFHHSLFYFIPFPYLSLLFHSFYYFATHSLMSNTLYYATLYYAIISRLILWCQKALYYAITAFSHSFPACLLLFSFTCVLPFHSLKYFATPPWFSNAPYYASTAFISRLILW